LLIGMAVAWGSSRERARTSLAGARRCRKKRAEAVEEEYTRLFLTIGRPEVMLFGSFYIAGFLMEEPVVELRDDLAELGLGRRMGIMESEDHIAAH
jgi:TorA maturation chaperone TorD